MAKKTKKKAAKKPAAKPAKKAAHKAPAKKAKAHKPAAKAHKPAKSGNPVTKLIEREVEGAYNAAFGCIALCTDAELNWKPATGQNWMTLGQLLDHVTNSCGACVMGFEKNDWSHFGMPGGGENAPKHDAADEACKEECMEECKDDNGGMPTADKMPTAKSIADVKKRLEADKALALHHIRKAGESRLEHEHSVAPWGFEGTLGAMVMDSAKHLRSHQHQLFYYLKLMGKPVHTGTLWGM